MSDINCTIQDLHYYLQDSGRVFTQMPLGYVVTLLDTFNTADPLGQMWLARDWTPKWPNPDNYMDVIV